MNEKDYKKLVGKEVTYEGQRGFIAGVDPEIGITIKPLDVDAEYLYCLNMKVGVERFGHEKAREYFDRRVEFLLKNDVITSQDILDSQREEKRTDGLGWVNGVCLFNK